MFRKNQEVKFKVPQQAFENLNTSGVADELASSPSASEFEVPVDAIRALGNIAGNLSGADELLSNQEDPQQDIKLDEKEELEENEEPSWLIERKNRLKNTDFSFIFGKTSHLYERLPLFKIRKAEKVRDILIERYGDRGVSEKSIGLHISNEIYRKVRGSVGSMVVRGSIEKYDEIYIVHFGIPIEDRINPQNGRRESRDSYLRYRFRKHTIFDISKVPADTDYSTLSSDVIIKHSWSPSVRIK